MTFTSSVSGRFSLLMFTFSSWDIADAVLGGQECVFSVSEDGFLIRCIVL
jgi:hypothetical protein